MVGHRAARLLAGTLRDPASVLRAMPALLGRLEEELARGRVRRRLGMTRGLPTVDILDLFPDFEETVSPYACLEGSSPPIDIVLLRLFARRFEGCRYFEIGAWRGESLSSVAGIAGECVSVSLSDVRWHSGMLPPGFASQFHFFSRDLSNVTSYDADSTTFDYSPFAGRCDLVFVDGGHGYAAVRSDTRNAFRLLRDERSVVVWHDYGYSSERVRWSVLEAILDGCPERERRHLYHVSNTMCAVYVRDLALPTVFTAFPMTPDKSFDITVRGHRLAERDGARSRPRPRRARG